MRANIAGKGRFPIACFSRSWKRLVVVLMQSQILIKIQPQRCILGVLKNENRNGWQG